MIKMAWHLLMQERKKTINLCQCTASTVAVCLLFMEILKSPYLSMNDSNFLFNALLTFFVIFVCVILMVYASDYFIRIKSREMGLLILAGLGSLKLFIYSLVQVLLIVVVGAVLGTVIFFIINPLIQAYLYYLLQIEANIFYVDIDALFQGLAIVLAIILVIMLLNSGFLARTGVSELLENHNVISYKKDTRVVKPPQLFWPFIYGFGLLCMYTGTNQVGGYLLFALMGALGVYGLFHHYLPHYYSKNVLSKAKNAHDLLIKKDVSLLMQQSKSFIAILMIVMIGMVPLICGLVNNSLFNFELHLAFVIANVLLSLTLIERFKIDAIQRKEHFHNIHKLGFTKEEIGLVNRQEIINYFNHLWILSIIYIINIFIVFYLNQEFELITMVIIMVEYLIPYLIAEIIILKERRKEISHDEQYS